MFDRFTDVARRVVVLAQREARDLHHGHIGTEHLLLALLEQPSTDSARVLSEHGLSRAAVVDGLAGYRGPDGLDAEALTTLGIDLGAVRDRVETAFGPGALDRDAPRRDPRSADVLPFSPRAKNVLERSLSEALDSKRERVADGHILLGLLREHEGRAMRVLHDCGIDPEVIRRDLTTVLSG